jgi:hypothetical protein
LSDHNAFIQQREFFPRTTKNLLGDPSEICALDFAEQFPRFRICSISATIGIDRSIFQISGKSGVTGLSQKRPSAV